MSENEQKPKTKPVTWQGAITLILFTVAVCSSTIAVMQGLFIKDQNQKIIQLQNDYRTVDREQTVIKTELAVLKIDVYGQMKELVTAVTRLNVDLQAKIK